MARTFDITFDAAANSFGCEAAGGSASTRRA
jgi:hypothetical protein